MDTHSRNRLPVYRWHSGTNLSCVVLCDHAANRVPSALNNLGLSDFDLTRHIAWDIGAADVARRLATHLKSPWIEHGFSRLLIDANRRWDDPTLVPQSSDGIVIPGNQALSAAAIQSRWRSYHQPYHRRIDRHLNQMRSRSIAPLIISIHSFTQRLGTANQPRPWPVGVLWRDDPSFAHMLIRELGRDGTLVGDNQPYDGHLAMGYTVDHHAKISTSDHHAKCRIFHAVDK